eukprot:3465152-Prymnesium_polylepis.1
MQQQVALARNGKKVLSVMLSHAEDPLRPFKQDARHQLQIASGLSKQLPWLSAFDRRDSLTVKHVRSSVGRRLSPQTSFVLVA